MLLLSLPRIYSIRNEVILEKRDEKKLREIRAEIEKLRAEIDAAKAVKDDKEEDKEEDEKRFWDKALDLPAEDLEDIIDAGDEEDFDTAVESRGVVVGIGNVADEGVVEVLFPGGCPVNTDAA